jgi:thymidylate synthase
VSNNEDSTSANQHAKDTLEQHLPNVKLTHEWALELAQSMAGKGQTGAAFEATLTVATAAEAAIDHIEHAIESLQELIEALQAQSQC